MAVEWIGKHVYPIYEAHLRGRKTFEYVAEYEANQQLSSDELHALQLAKLKRLLAHCEAQVPFYQRHWAMADVSSRDLREVADLRHFPTIDKGMIRANQADMVASSWQGRTMRKSTGGSTGQPFSFEVAGERFEQRRQAGGRAVLECRLFGFRVEVPEKLLDLFDRKEIVARHAAGEGDDVGPRSEAHKLPDCRGAKR